MSPQGIPYLAPVRDINIYSDNSNSSGSRALIRVWRNTAKNKPPEVYISFMQETPDGMRLVSKLPLRDIDITLLQQLMQEQENEATEVAKWHATQDCETIVGSIPKLVWLNK